MKTIKSQSFKEFYAILPLLPGYSAESADEIKEEIVRSYSDGKTTSLRELREVYPTEYNMMMFDLRKKTSSQKRKYGDEGEKWRRRVIAAICSYLDGRGQRFNTRQQKIAYAMTIAQRAAGAVNFNKISITGLQRIYNTFGAQKSYQEIDDAGYQDATISDWTRALNDALTANKIMPSKMNSEEPVK